MFSLNCSSKLSFSVFHSSPKKKERKGSVLPVYLPQSSHCASKMNHFIIIFLLLLCFHWLSLSAHFMLSCQTSLTFGAWFFAGKTFSSSLGDIWEPPVCILVLEGRLSTALWVHHPIICPEKLSPPLDFLASLWLWPGVWGKRNVCLTSQLCTGRHEPWGCWLSRAMVGGWQGSSCSAVSCNSGGNDREGDKASQHWVNKLRIWQRNFELQAFAAFSADMLLWLLWWELTFPFHPLKRTATCVAQAEGKSCSFWRLNTSVPWDLLIKFE